MKMVVLTQLMNLLLLLILTMMDSQMQLMLVHLNQKHLTDSKMKMVVLTLM